MILSHYKIDLAMFHFLATINSNQILYVLD